MLEKPFFSLAMRVVLLFIFICILNLSARPLRETWEWAQVNEALKSGRPGAAAEGLARINAAAPWRQDLYYLTGQYALQAGNWALGLERLNHVSPGSLSAADWTAMGDASLKLGQPDQAIQAWKNSLAIEENGVALTRLYTIHRQQSNYPAILADLWALQRLQPENPDLTYQLAVHLAATAPRTALDFIEQADLTDETIQQKLHKLQGKLRTVTQQESAAGQMLGAGQGLAELGEWALAVQAFRAALQLEPEYAEAWAFLGEARQHLEPAETEAALEDLRQALRLNPASVAANSMLALYWQRQGDLSRAASLYRHTATLEPKNPAWFAALGGLASAQGDLTTAEGYYKYAASLAGQEAIYWRLLAGFYIVNQIQIEDGALLAASQAMSINPDDPANLDTLAQVNLLLNKLDETQRLLDEAILKDPHYAPAYLHLGMVFLLQGQGELARFQLEQARQMAQDQATANQAERLIQYYFP